jgi:hypothetical protein
MLEEVMKNCSKTTAILSLSQINLYLHSAQVDSGSEKSDSPGQFHSPEAKPAMILSSPSAGKSPLSGVTHFLSPDRDSMLMHSPPKQV